MSENVKNEKKLWRVKRVGLYDAWQSWQEFNICDGAEFYGTKEELLKHLGNSAHECRDEPCVEAGPLWYSDYWYPDDE